MAAVGVMGTGRATGGAEETSTGAGAPLAEKRADIGLAATYLREAIEALPSSRDRTSALERLAECEALAKRATADVG